MVPENFKENGFMIGLGLFIVVFVIAQSLFFLVKAWKQGKKLGITTDTLKNTVVSSAHYRARHLDSRNGHRARKLAGHRPAVDQTLGHR